MKIEDREIPKNAGRDAPEEDGYLKEALTTRFPHASNIKSTDSNVGEHLVEAALQREEKLAKLKGDKRLYDRIMKQLEPYKKDFQELEEVNELLQDTIQKLNTGVEVPYHELLTIRESSAIALEKGRRIDEKLKRTPDGDITSLYLHLQQLQPIAEDYTRIEELNKTIPKNN